MGENSKIEWTHHTFNPWRGCTKVSAGCKNCYAETMSGRNPAVLGEWGPRGTRVIAAESYWRQPYRWNEEAAQSGERRRVFCASLADVFEGRESMPDASWDAVERARWRLWEAIEKTPHLDWLLLTKRPQNINDMRVYSEWPANVWIGTSVEDQATADERIPHLLAVPARVRFLSCEPLIGPVDLGIIPDALYEAGMPFSWNRVSDGRGIHWVIVGGERGTKASPMHPAWARSLRDQCLEAHVPFFFKQWGEWLPVGQDMTHIIAYGQDNGRYRQSGTWRNLQPGVDAVRVGKQRAGRLLDGREWNEFPETEIAHDVR